MSEKVTSSDGSTASYYQLPAGAKELQDLISAANMNAQMGEIGRAWYRYGRCSHSSKLRDLKKIIFYAQAEIARLEKYESIENPNSAAPEKEDNKPVSNIPLLQVSYAITNLEALVPKIVHYMAKSSPNKNDLEILQEFTASAKEDANILADYYFQRLEKHYGDE